MRGNALVAENRTDLAAKRRQVLTGLVYLLCHPTMSDEQEVSHLASMLFMVSLPTPMFTI